MPEKRPRYETDIDLARERKLAALIEKKWFVTLEKIPTRYKLDYAGQRDGMIRCFVEVKTRTNARNDYPDYMLSLEKYDAGRYILDSYAPAFLVVQFSDEVAYFNFADIDHTTCRIAMGGRKDRNDPDDYEPCIYIPMSYFRTL